MAQPIKSAVNTGYGQGGSADPPRENPPSSNLWIGNVSPDVEEAELRSLFEKHGQIDSVTHYSSRNYAFVHFKDVEGAKSAKLSLQGHVLRGSSLKIEFAKPAKPCKSLWVAGISQSVSKEELEKEFMRCGKIQEFRFLRDRNTAYVDYVRLEDATLALNSMNGKHIGGSQIRVDFLRSQPSKRQFIHVGSQKEDAQFSKILWIRHPPSVIIEEDMLHNAMILFGEIERIKTFSNKNYAFVEFRSIDEARRAKEGLQGKLFNDPRILIEYFNSEFPEVRGQVGEFPFRPVQMDVRGLNPTALLSSNGIHGSDLYMRPPLGSHSIFEPALHGPELIDLAAGHKLQNPTPQSLMGGPNWRRSSPTPGVVSSPTAGFQVPKRALPGSWDVYDANQLQRESKRSRSDAALPLERSENQGVLDDRYGLHPLGSMGASGSLARGTAGGLGRRRADSDCIWRGVLAKTGNFVCHARCVPIGEGLDADIPDVINCAARTGLDLLSKRYEDAIGFDIVFFLPDSEEDFASYTDFLRYLGSKDRAGVAKFDDGTTLFLVPPSDFLTRVLKVSGPERLYGVVLKFPQVGPSGTDMNPEVINPQWSDQQKASTLQPGYSGFRQEERMLPSNNSKILPDNSPFPPKPPGIVSSAFPAQSVPQTSHAGLALTPELIASLTSLLPASTVSSGSQTVSVPQAPSVLGTTSNVSADPEANLVPWKHEQQGLDHNFQLMQQHAAHSQLYHPPGGQATPPVSHFTGSFHQAFNSYSQMHDGTINLPLHVAVSSRPMAPSVPLHNGMGTVVPVINQQYELGNSQDILRGQGIDNGPGALRFYNPSIQQQTAYPVALTNQANVGGVSMQQPYVPLSAEGDVTHHSQPLQTAPYGVIQESTEAEADKNERYKSTLLFAANLLSRIHQPSGNQPGQGEGSH